MSRNVSTLILSDSQLCCSQSQHSSLLDSATFCSLGCVSVAAFLFGGGTLRFRARRLSTCNEQLVFIAVSRCGAQIAAGREESERRMHAPPRPTLALVTISLLRTVAAGPSTSWPCPGKKDVSRGVRSQQRGGLGASIGCRSPDRTLGKAAASRNGGNGRGCVALGRDHPFLPFLASLFSAPVVVRM